MKNMLSRILGVNNVIIVLLLSLMFLNISNYWYVLAILPIGYLLMFRFRYVSCDTTLVLLFLFGLMYMAFAAESEVPMSVKMTLVLIFPMLYVMGRYIGRTESDNGVVNVMYILAFAMAAMYLFSISESVAEEGFAVDDRNMEIQGSGSNIERSATGIYSNLMILSMFLLSLFIKLPYKKKLIYVIGAALAMYSSVRIQSRTSIMLLLAVGIVILVLNLKTVVLRNLWVTITSIVLISGITFYVLNTYEEELMIIERFQEDDTKTAGDRTVLSANVVNALQTHPFGGLEHMPYAHNLWLDTARVAGIVPFVILVVITLMFIPTLINIYTNRRHSFNYRFMMTVFALAFIIYMNTEPVLEGCPILFGLFCLFMGMTREHNKVIDCSCEE